MRFGSLFTGIGGIDLGLERAGMKCIWQVEIDEFCQKVLTKHWPDIPKYGDIHDVGRHNLETPDLIAGGFPCQPVSVAGKQKGVEDERWLWPEFYRVVSELRPRYVLVENVPGLYHLGFGEIITNLAEGGYDAEWNRIFAASVGAPHLRERVFIVAYTNKWRCQGKSLSIRQSRQDEAPPVFVRASKNVSNSSPMQWSSIKWDEQDRVLSEVLAVSKSRRIKGEQSSGAETWRPSGSSWWEFEPDVGRVAHGVPSRVDRLRSLGNAVVPQVAEWVGRRIMEHETHRD